MTQTTELAKLIKAMSWEEMDDFAARIVEIANDDNNEANDARFIAGMLCGDATETLKE